MEKMKKLSFIEYQGYIPDNAKTISDLMTAKSATEKINMFLDQNRDSTIDIRLSAELTRSQQQNRFWHACLLPAIQKALILSGDTNPMLLNLEYVKQNRIKPMFLSVNLGSPDFYIRSTTDLSVNEFMKFCESCMEFLINIMGALDNNVMSKYMAIIEKYHLNNAFDKKMS